MVKIADEVAKSMDQPLWHRLRDDGIYDPKRIQLHVAEHRLIYEAIVSGDADAAALLCRGSFETCPARHRHPRVTDQAGYSEFVPCGFRKLQHSDQARPLALCAGWRNSQVNERLQHDATSELFLNL